MNKRIAIEEGDEDQGTIIPALPHHLIYEILARLPLKSLMRFKAVSKEWLYTIHDQSLATDFSIHRSQIHAAAPTCLILFSPMKHYYSLDLDSGLAIPFENLNQPQFEGAEVWNTVMGLTCFEAKGITYFWNIRTREITALPQTEPDFPVNSEFQSATSIGFDPVKGQYKILKMWSLYGATLPRKLCQKVITLGTSEWRKIDNGFPMRVTRGLVFTNGKLHYLTKDMDEKDIVVAFHVGTEKFEVIEMPQEYVGYLPYLIPYRNRLAFYDIQKLANESIMSVGVLEDYQDRKWVIKNVELPEGWKRPGLDFASGITTGEILFTPQYTNKTPFNVYRFDMEKRSMKKVEIHGLPDDLLLGEVVVRRSPIEYGESILSLKKLNLGANI